MDPIALGVVINRTTGKTFAEWVQDEVFMAAGFESNGMIAQDHFKYSWASGAMRATLPDWIRFAVWMKESQKEDSCFGSYLKEATKTQVQNPPRSVGQSWGGYGYLLWTQNNAYDEAYGVSGYGGQHIIWNQKNSRIIINFANVDNFSKEFYGLYRQWASLP